MGLQEDRKACGANSSQPEVVHVGEEVFHSFFSSLIYIEHLRIFLYTLLDQLEYCFKTELQCSIYLYCWNGILRWQQRYTNEQMDHLLYIISLAHNSFHS